MSKTNTIQETRELRYKEQAAIAEKMLHNLPERRPYLLKRENLKFDKYIVWLEELFLNDLSWTAYLPFHKVNEITGSNLSQEEISDIFNCYRSIKMPVEKNSIVEGIPLNKIINIESAKINPLGTIFDFSEHLTEYGKDLIKRADFLDRSIYLNIAGPDDEKSLYGCYHNIIGSRRLCFLKPDENGKFIY